MQPSAISITDEALNNKELLRTLLKMVNESPSMRKEFESILFNGKPLSAKHKHTGPYYKQIYGEQLKPFLDLLLEEEKKEDGKKSLLFHYEKYPSLTKNTLYHRVAQSFLYVCREMDADGIYTSLHKRTIIAREDNCIAIHLQYKLLANDKLTATIGEIKERASDRKGERNPDWKQKVDDFLECNGVVEEGKPPELMLTDLRLSPIDIEWFNNMIAPLDNFAGRAEKTKIVLRKIA
jgi:hypothetical protein